VKNTLVEMYSSNNEVRKGGEKGHRGGGGNLWNPGGNILRRQRKEGGKLLVKKKEVWGTTKEQGKSIKGNSFRSKKSAEQTQEKGKGTDGGISRKRAEKRLVIWEEQGMWGTGGIFGVFFFHVTGSRKSGR